MIYILADTVEYWHGKIVKPFKPAEKEIVTIVGSNNRNYVAVFNTRYYSRLQAFLGMEQTLLVITVLAVGSLMLTKITIDLVITPIEIMIKKSSKSVKIP